jgi:flagellar biosynthetic protein FlhB
MAADDDDKTEEATQRKLMEARRKGDIVYSPEVGAAFSLLAATIFVAFMAAPMAHEVAHGFIAFLGSAHEFATTPRALTSLMGASLAKLAGIVGLTALAFVIAAITARYVQDAPTFTAARLEPKLDKLNPVQGFSRIFGKQALSAFLKSLAKFVVVGAAVAWALWPSDASLERMPLMAPAAILQFVQDKAVALMLAVVAATTVIALIDYVATRQSYRQRQRMSRRELRDEHRQSEGDPLVRLKLRQVRQERARKRMMAQVPNATVVVTNPTHYAVALKYEAETTPAPVCLAKGVDDVALRIRALAEENNVPIIEDPPLARALFASADIDEPIPREHYEAVARVIGVVLGLARNRRRWPPPRRAGV